MKYLPSYILLLLAATACDKDDLERTYDLTPRDNSPVLVMNALMDGGEESHSIELFTSYAQTTEMATASNLAVEINGSPVYAGASQKGGEVIYSAFHSGDRLSIRATAGSRTVSAEVTVPEKPEILSCEGVLSDGTMICHITLRDKPGVKNWYRISVDESLAYDHYSRYGTLINHQEEYNHSRDIDTSHDPVISSGYTSEGNDLFSAMVPENTWHIFSDDGFEGKEVTLRVDVPVGSLRERIAQLKDWNENNGEDYEEFQNIEGSFILKVYGISQDQYQYLKAVTQMEFSGSDFNFLVEPIPLPTNVSGGLGLVAVDMPTPVRVESGL